MTVANDDANKAENQKTMGISKINQGGFMMFHADITLVLSVIAFTMGLKLLFKAKKHNDMGTGAYKFWGWVICIITAIIFLFAGYRTICCASHMGKYNYKMMRQHMMQNVMQAQADKHVKKK